LALQESRRILLGSVLKSIDTKKGVLKLFGEILDVRERVYIGGSEEKARYKRRNRKF